MPDAFATPADAAPQHGPRPLPLFLAMLRRETEGAPERRRAALAGLSAYQRAARPEPAPPLPIIATAGRVTLRDAGGAGRPVVFVPSLINPPHILDLSADKSLLRWTAARGYRALLVDWGEPGEADRDLDLAAHVGRLLVPLLATLPEPPVLVGYCLGGTLAIAAAAAMPVAGLATIAAPWRFAGYGEGRLALAERWAAAQTLCEALGVLPMELLQAGFWQLDPARTIAKYEAFAAMPPASDAQQAFVALEDWANGGAPLPYAAGRDLFETLLAADAPGSGAWRVGGQAVDPLALTCPVVEFVSATDRIVPAATAIGWPDARVLSAGHVGMIIGGGAERRLWTPLAEWIGGLP